MTDLSTHQQLFFGDTGWNETAVEAAVAEALHGLDDGELFCEYSVSETVSWENGSIRSASYNTEKGYGLRGVQGETTAYAHSTDFSAASLARAAEVVRSMQQRTGAGIALEAAPFGHAAPLYTSTNPLAEVALPQKTELMAAIDAYLRTKDPRVKQVMCSLSGAWSAIYILRGDGQKTGDIRPLVRLNISVVVEQNGRRETSFAGMGGRRLYGTYITPEAWQPLADEALEKALLNLEAIPAPAGEMPVVLGSGWCGVLLHEAIGHGLEGDFNRKQTSAFAGLVGQRVAAEGVTVVDDGTIEGRRGSLSMDDEGTPTECTTLIENGILKGYMHDRMSARLMNARTTGNGRRESYAHAPLPRMTNTYMLGGTTPREEMIARVPRGIYAANFGGGQVDITSGKFVFSASEAYLIENGKITAPIKGATLIGNGPDVLTRVQMVGNDMALDKGVGVCGKAGQSVPAGVGQPSMLIDKMTVGGTHVGA